MPLLKFTLDEDSVDILRGKYRKTGYCLGKSKKGYKKWTKQYIRRAIKELAKSLDKVS